jgi:hypothetical protein
MLVLDDEARARLKIPVDMVGVFDGSSFIHVTCFATDQELSAALHDGGAVLSSDVIRMGIDPTCLSCGGRFVSPVAQLSGPPVADGSLIVMGADGLISSSTYVGRPPTRVGIRAVAEPVFRPPVVPCHAIPASQLLPYAVDHGGDQYIVCARGPAELDRVIQERRAARAERASRDERFLPPAIPRIVSVEMRPLRAEDAAICLADMARSLSAGDRVGR